MKNHTSRITAAVILSMIVVLLFPGCGKADTPQTVSESGSGSSSEEELDEPGSFHDNSDREAPKEIESKEIVEFSARFFVFDDFDSSHGSLYRYEITSADGVYTLSEKRRYRIETEISENNLADVQALIEKNNLASLNGIHSQTDGLPAEYQPCYLDVLYASGETLSFSFDGEPYSKWMRDFRSYFDSVFTEAGFEETAPDEENYTIDYFTIEFNEGPLAYSYGTIQCEDKQRLNCSVWDMERDQSVSDRYASLEGGFLTQLSELIEELEMQEFSGHYEKVDYTPDGYVDIYISYMGSRRLYASFGPDAIPEEWDSMRIKLKTFMDAYIEEYLEAGSYEELQEIIYREQEGSST